MVATTLLTLLVITEAGGGALRAGIRRISDSPTLQCNCKCTSPGFQPAMIVQIKEEIDNKSQTFFIDIDTVSIHVTRAARAKSSIRRSLLVR